MEIDTMIPLDDWRAIPETARRAEALGFGGVMAPEIQYDPFIPLAFAATATERVRLGTAVAIAFPRSPMMVANLSYDLARNSRGRFVLGLGTQVKGHNERRFSVRWESPGPRLREYVEALRAIWRCWEKKEPLRYEGRFYQFTLMTPEFSPPPTGLAPIPVTIAAVQPYMLRLSGEVCDGVRLHGFCTKRYLEAVCLPAIEEGLRRAGRERARFEIWGGGFVATGKDADEVRRAVEETRYRIAFYGSTRTYSGVLSLHGWDEQAAKLHELSKRGRWDEMAKVVSDEMVETFAAVAPYDGLVGALRERFGGLSDRVFLSFPRATPDGLARELLSDIRRIPARFAGWS
ncbi:MAG: TIGR03617 family F420-dependent LLM class oxidoreductase [Candidatus Binatia bacterium]|jgi:probable F420-dependent oxidoreductase